MFPLNNLVTYPTNISRVRPATPPDVLHPQIQPRLHVNINRLAFIPIDPPKNKKKIISFPPKSPKDLHSPKLGIVILPTVRVNNQGDWVVFSIVVDACQETFHEPGRQAVDPNCHQLLRVHVVTFFGNFLEVFTIAYGFPVFLQRRSINLTNLKAKLHDL